MEQRKLMITMVLFLKNWSQIVILRFIAYIEKYRSHYRLQKKWRAPASKMRTPPTPIKSPVATSTKINGVTLISTIASPSFELRLKMEFSGDFFLLWYNWLWLVMSVVWPACSWGDPSSPEWRRLPRQPTPPARLSAHGKNVERMITLWTTCAWPHAMD